MRSEVRAQIAGSMLSHVASIGQHVKVGEVICMTECMKTEIHVESPVDGTVTWLRSCGETIEADDVIVILDV